MRRIALQQSNPKLPHCCGLSNRQIATAGSRQPPKVPWKKGTFISFHYGKRAGVPVGLFASPPAILSGQMRGPLCWDPAMEANWASPPQLCTPCPQHTMPAQYRWPIHWPATVAALPPTGSGVQCWVSVDGTTLPCVLDVPYGTFARPVQAVCL